MQATAAKQGKRWGHEGYKAIVDLDWLVCGIGLGDPAGWPDSHLHAKIHGVDDCLH